MHKTKGFTLVELVVTVAVIAILASIALPSYLEHVEKAQCEDGKALLSNAANYMERQRAANGGRFTGIDLNGFGHSSKVFTPALSNITATNYTLTVSTTSAARISGDLTLNAANAHGGSLTGKCTW